MKNVSISQSDKPTPQFSSFFWAGFECTYALTEIRERLDMLAASRHDEYCRIDYTLLKEHGITTAREGLSWSQIDQGNGLYDFSRFEKIMQIGQEEGVQQIWDLNHFDFPTYLNAYSEKFVQQFAKYAVEALHVIRKYQNGIIYIAPINEISFFAWIGADQGVWAPYKRGAKNGQAFKKQLVRASLAAMKAIWAEDTDVRFIHIDPFMRRYALEPANKAAIRHVDEFNNIIRFEAWDMICGKTFPELGGDPKYLDIIGMNYYFHNQEFVLSKPKTKIAHQAMEWDSTYRVPFWQMIQEVHDRYHKPIVISETGSYGELRFQWWERTLAEIDNGLKKGLPILGVCAYPAVDRPDDVNYLIRRSGLWDFEDNDPHFLRVPHTHSLEVIQQYIKKWKRTQ
jgi:beta-glucosidase/6-phospho-beta-glucosidase/beta-galactosidase